ncbi:MAG: hypothetical protein WB290_17170 [Smithella sp.]
MTRDRIEQIIHECLKELLKKDSNLLKNDVSERTITHKLAEYLQDRIPNLNVDCEYNRNYELGERVEKILYVLNIERKEKIRSGLLEEDDLLAISTYPDIIVHRRMTNAKNLLVIEVKKKNSRVSRDHDFKKLRAFTDSSNRNLYHYKYGVFILLDTGTRKLEKPELTWFINGSVE